ncbi:uncharacterized protein IL334_001602 [Kwoniella shivajii]|uniref:Nuclear control of ATPase protein 2 n=1 Tax=Kwoniella shivajii TaxID=564305 RepID=A0ABZ1CSL1_9TREE|nr:hypothetical protein IL334_001602 [Kwoniella shivajii]
MAFLFHSSTPSYASEQLSSHLSSLSTSPISTPPSQPIVASSSTSTNDIKAKPAHKLQNALHELSSSRSISKEKLVEVLESLVKTEQNGITIEEKSEIDQEVEAEVLGRAVTIVWKEILQTLVEKALELEEERNWWDASLNSTRGVGVYLLQTMPHRIYAALPPRSKFLRPELKAFKLPREALFKPIRTRTSATLISITSPFNLTRREMLSSRSELSRTRDEIAQKIGILASKGPNWSSDSTSTNENSSTASSSPSSTNGVFDAKSETERIFKVLYNVLELESVQPQLQQATPVRSSSSRKSKRTPSPPTTISITTTPSSLIDILRKHLPKTTESIDKVLTTHKRPSALTRLWFPALFLPPTLYFIASAISRNKEWMREQVKNGKETIKGFFVQWVWEPIEDIAKTLRGGGEGLGVAPTTVKSDQESLERMVLDLGRDYYHLSGPQLDALGEKVRAGDMEEVLRVYEKEMQSPVKNALLGSLVRTLLIQVQKTKTDLSLSLLSLDHLLRSQQLTFAAVGLAPSLLVLYGLGGWLQGVWRGEKRGKGRKRTYFNGLRSIERLLITSPKHAQELSEKDRGLLIVSVSGMRTWATGLSGNSRESFMDDLRMVEDPILGRGDKLRVIERIWRCWGVEGTRKI